MNILVINAGSSSLKFQLYNMQAETVLAKGVVERIGTESAILTQQSIGKPTLHAVKEILDHTTAIRQVLATLVDEEYGAIGNIGEIHAVGHRVVHGGETFAGPAFVTPEVKEEIIKQYDLAPLHNPVHMMGIVAVEANLPDIPQVVVFDTAFHQTMPQSHYMYPIPRVLYSKHKVRRYGFHGTSHAFVSKRAAELVGKPLEDLKMITCHIGNGASLAAIMDGKSFDTSMGMTPLEGLMMGTRSGDIDPAIVPYTMIKEELTVGEVNSMLNKHSGLYAISGISGDMREIEQARKDGDRNAMLAFEMFEYRMRKYIGSYVAAMNGLDVLVFTAGIGENSVTLRKEICHQLTYLGLKLDDELNARTTGVEGMISVHGSKVAVLVVPTNEELTIARETYELVKGKGEAIK